MDKDKARDLFPGALEMMVLRTLKRQPLHGVCAGAAHSKRTSNDLLQIEEGSLLSGAAEVAGKDELVKAEWGTSATGRRVRIYKLTPAGAKRLEHEVSQFEKMLEGITAGVGAGGSCRRVGS